MSGFLNLWRPQVYHGHGRKRGFFEGWYFKLVDASESHRYAVIPGVFLAKAEGSSHAFVQTLDGVSGYTSYHRYPLSEFRASTRDFEIQIGPNHFRADRLTLDLDHPDGHMAGQLQFRDLVPWPISWASPGIMGWYAFAPFMECYHGIVSLDHRISGYLEVQGEPVDFRGGHGYTEKDWGQAFPRAWIWMQSNHFAQPGACFTASVADIPWIGRAFRGFIIGLWHGGKLYRLATYTGARITTLQLTDTHVLWDVVGQGKQGHQTSPYRLEIRASRAEGGLLHAPARVAMLQRVPETLTASIEIRLTHLDGATEQVVFQGQGRHAGLEIAGSITDLLDGSG